MTVNELVALAKEQFPNTRLTDEELKKLAERILAAEPPKRAFQEVHT